MSPFWAGGGWGCQYFLLPGGECTQLSSGASGLHELGSGEGSARQYGGKL